MTNSGMHDTTPVSDVAPLAAAAAQTEPEPIEQLCIDTIRTLAIDAVQAANS